MTTVPENGRTHEPSLREVTAQLDDLAKLVDTRFKYVEKVMDERDRLYKERADLGKIAIDSALAAAKEQTGSSFAASEKAIVKAEEAQREYNIRSNEFRGQLDDQAKLLMPRQESITLSKAYDDKLEDLKVRFEANTLAMTSFLTIPNYDREHQNLAQRVAVVEAFLSNYQGRLWMLGAVIVGTISVIGLALKFWK